VRILLTNATTIFAGGEDYVLILAQYLRQRNHEVWVSAHPGHLLLEKCEKVGIPTFPIVYGDMGRVPQTSWMLRDIVRRHGIAIVHSNANYDRTCAALATAFLPARHVASIHSGHSIQHNLTHWIRNRWGTEKFIADADSVKQVLMEEDRIDGSRIAVVPIGVEQHSLELEERWRAATRRELGIPEKMFVIGNVARLVPFKGHQYLLEAAALILPEHPATLFLIIGDGELQGSLEQQARALGIDQHVRFLGFRDNLHELYPGFDLYCHSSIELAAEAFPLAILRALSSRKPVVATRVGGITMMIESGKSGFLTEPENPYALAQAIMTVMRNRDLQESMAKKTDELFLRSFHASAMAAHVEQVYYSVLSN
jgi:glycosyltransferase involved in cell wall biosynthesis